MFTSDSPKGGGAKIQCITQEVKVQCFLNVTPVILEITLIHSKTHHPAVKQFDDDEWWLRRKQNR